MEQVSGSRRQFVGGAVATGAVLGGLALLGRGGELGHDAGDGVTIVSGRDTLPAMTYDPAELDHWTAAIGQPVRVAGERGYAAGTVASVQRANSDGPRPANQRREAFTVTFHVDRATAPAGDAIYDIGQAIDGLTRLFLVRGGDVGRHTVLFALFN